MTKAQAPSVPSLPRQPLTGGPEQTIDQIKEELSRENTSPIDCNNNGISDAVDIASGYDDDINHNAAIDFCDPDEAVRRAARADRSWQVPSTDGASTYFVVRMRERPIPPGVYDVALIRYFVREASVVTLSVHNVNKSEIDTVLVRQKRQSGPVEVVWNQKLHGRYVPGGTYEFTLAIGPQTLKRRLAWAR